MSEEFESAKVEMKSLVGSLKSVMLATATSSGVPSVSYAPVYVGEGMKMYVFLSSMAKHYGLLKRGEQASAMFIEDEGTSGNLFARKRLTFDCSSVVLQRDSEQWNSIINQMVTHLGETMEYLKGMLDFDLFELSPQSGRLVLDFGKAYQISGEDLEGFGYVKASGHRRKDD